MELSKGKKILVFSTFTVVGLYFLFLGLVEASGFLAPLLTAILLALIVLPLSQKMETKGINKGWSSFLSAFLLFLISLGFIALVSFQIRSFVDDWPKIQKTMAPKVEQLKSFVFEHTPMDKSDLQSSSGSSGSQNSGKQQSSSGEGKSQNSGQQQSSAGSEGNAQGSGQQQSSAGSEGSAQGSGQQQGSALSSGSSSQASGSQSSSSSAGAGSKAQKALSFFQKTIGFMGTFLLTFIYIFFLLDYRKRFKEFILRLFPDRRKDEVREVIQKSAKVSQNYLVGKLMLMGFLAVIYSIGLGISGVNNFILVSLIAALLTLIPYIGNIIGLVMAMAFGYLTSGETGVLIGTAVTFAVAQFVESYVLEPYVVGDKVKVHPFIVIIGVVAGGALWGVIGMILAIPVLGILTIIFLHIGPLHPFGFLFSNKDSAE